MFTAVQYPYKVDENEKQTLSYTKLIDGEAIFICRSMSSHIFNLPVRSLRPLTCA